MLFDNTIDELLVAAKCYEEIHKTKPFFVSDWNPSESNLIFVQLDNNIDNEKINNYNYLYSIDDINYKDNFKNYCDLKSYNHKLFDFSLFSNSTVALYLIFKSLKMHSKKNVLVFTPCYFTSESALLSLEFNVIFKHLSMSDFDEDEILSVISENNIACILITDPIYGMGLSIKTNIYEALIRIANQQNVTLIIDYSYGNMVWSESEHIFNYNLVSMLAQSEIDYYIVDSLPKKMFLNGVKFSLLFSNTKNITFIENLSLFVEGSITSNQFKNYYGCYNKDNALHINRIVNKYISKCQNTYNLIQSYLIDNPNLEIENADSGIFALISMPRHNPVKEDINFSKRLINECGVFVTPHSRYKFYNNSRFYFRINLLLEQEILLESLSKISNLQ